MFVKTTNMAECLNCGKKIKQTPGRRPRIYCSDNCKQKAWQKKNKKQKPAKKAKKTTSTLSSKINYKESTPESFDRPKLDRILVDEAGMLPVLGPKKPFKGEIRLAAPKKEDRAVNPPQNSPEKNEKGWVVREIAKMPAGLTQLQQQLWKAEQKKIKNNNV